MKILAVADIHGAYGHVEQILQRVRADVCVIAGDISTKGSEKEIRNTFVDFQKHQKNIFAVCGNMDFPATENLLIEKNIALNAHGCNVDYVGFFGVSGAPLSSMHTPYEISEEEIYHRACVGYELIQQTRIKIFVSHAPPINTAVDKINVGIHAGSTGIRKFIEKYQPEICICGHIHEAIGQDKVGNTLIVNCGPASKYYVEIDIGKEVFVEHRMT
jgi:Icc-related predicted phosphoesterase